MEENHLKKFVGYRLIFVGCRLKFVGCRLIFVGCRLMPNPEPLEFTGFLGNLKQRNI